MEEKSKGKKNISVRYTLYWNFSHVFDSIQYEGLKTCLEEMTY